MTTDRELLELAAKAVGYDTSHHWNEYRMTLNPPIDDLCIPGVSTAWNPLTNDGDEARLEAKLSLEIEWYPALVLVGLRTGISYDAYFDEHNGDKQAARRRAGVRAAAEIGKAMK